jgi:hypothetical protein
MYWHIGWFDWAYWHATGQIRAVIVRKPLPAPDHPRTG